MSAVHEQDMQAVLTMLAGVMDRMTQDTEIGRILMPGPTYLGMWARDTGVATLGLNRLGRWKLAGELLERYWGFQITEESDPETFIFRNKRFANWTDADAFLPTARQLAGEIGAFPTSVYIRTRDFPPGTREIYTVRADIDSVAWLIIALEDNYRHSGDIALLTRLEGRLRRALEYLVARDVDGDYLLEQGPNQDWADILLRHGKVSYTQAVWFRCLGCAASIFEALGDGRAAAAYRERALAVRGAINEHLLTPHGFYANYRHMNGFSLRRALDTSLLIAFGVEPTEEVARSVLACLDRLEGPFGPAVMEPGYTPADIGPAKYPPSQYQNEGIWPWITSYLVLAWAKVGNADRARRIVSGLVSSNPGTIHEWIDNLTGEAHHPDFATAAGALAWALTEGSLATWNGQSPSQDGGSPLEERY